MKTFNYVLIAMLLTLGSVNLRAQSGLSFEATQYYTTFSFTDSQGTPVSKEYKGIFNGAYSAAYNYTTDFGLMVRAGIGMRKAGANLVYDDMNYSWSMQYGETKAGLGYIYFTEAVNPYLMVSGYYAYMLSGTQILNNEHINLIESGLLNKTDFGVIVSPGVEIGISENLSSFIEMKYLMGLQNLETSELQKSTNMGYGLTAGIAIKF